MIFLEERIGRLLQELSQRMVPREMQIERYNMTETQQQIYDVSKLDLSQAREFSSTEYWGGHRRSFWFDTEVTIPTDFAGECVLFEVTTGREAGWDATNPQFALYVDGKLRQGLDVNHRSALLCEEAQAGASYRLTLSAYTGDGDDPIKLKSRLIVLDRKTEQYFFDLNVPFQVARLLDKEDQAYIQIIQSLNDSLNMLDLRRHGPDYQASLEKARTYLQTHFYEKHCGVSSPTVCCVGHTHIDVAWLWTLAVTEDKTVRSFSTVLALMDEYPEYIFMSSQPQLYHYMQKNAPEVFEIIRQRVREDRWEADGAMFVEADCNIAGGEALVRQILVGKRYFAGEFGVDNKILWLPDVFGYSAALPQIMQKSGIPYFMTTKISWNEFNKMPYDTFDWIGIDGSKVLTHFIPTRDYQAKTGGRDRPAHFTTYNGNLNPSQVKGAWQRYQQKHLNDSVLMSFGYGDGGGGPTREMLENQRRLALGIPGSPRTEMMTAGRFFDQLSEKVKDSKSLPAWSGELYLEYHRGTYTSMARNKKYNRRSEYAWLNVEWLSAVSDLLAQTGYPREAITEGWDVVLRNQFHDILPGSSIKEVYDDSKIEYEGTLAQSANLIRQNLNQITARISHMPGKELLVVFNPNGLAMAGTVIFDHSGARHRISLNDGGRIYSCQLLSDGRWLACVPEIPAKGYRSFELMCTSVAGKTEQNRSAADEKTAITSMQISAGRMVNAFFDLRLDEQGHFVSLVDKRNGRELIPRGEKANVLVSYEDKPHNYDAWDINNYYQEKFWPVNDVQSIEVIENGELRACLQIRRQYLQSTIVQSIYFWRDLPQIDLRYEIDWKEEQILLKAHFPTDIHSSQATFDIQYGNVQRATHSNTSWDFARFEVCMHKWLDLSEDDYGLSILNDSKYGCNVKDQTIGLSLLKSAIRPNPDADKEKHDFTFTLLPHLGGWRQAGTVREAYRLNNPLLAVVRDAESALSGQAFLPAEFSLVQSDQENVIIESVKQAEDSTDLIVRLYECYNRRTRVHLTLGAPALKIAECDLMENEIAVIETAADSDPAAPAVDLLVRPYEIRTLKISFQLQYNGDLSS